MLFKKCDNIYERISALKKRFYIKKPLNKYRVVF